MKSPVETIISLLAPHRCIGCGLEGTLLCESCSAASIIAPPSRCFLCHKATPQHQVCASCRRKSRLCNVWVAAEYDEAAKKLVHKLKFERAQAAADILAAIMDESLPDLPADTVITHVPTANKRVRIRGYDQSKLIAKSLAKRRGWQYRELLLRLGSSRQVGSSRKDRLVQLEDAFRPKFTDLKDKQVLLVDDVTTTGATLEMAAKTLKSVGARKVSAIVFAQPIK